MTEQGDGGPPPCDGRAAGGNGEAWEVRLWGFPRPGGVRRGPGNDGPADAVRKLGPEELFGRAVHFLRLCRGLRLEDLAARAGMSIGRLSGIENGKYRAWRGSADAVAQALTFPDARALLDAVYGDDYPPADPAGP